MPGLVLFDAPDRIYNNVEGQIGSHPTADDNSKSLVHQLVGDNDVRQWLYVASVATYSASAGRARILARQRRRTPEPLSVSVHRASRRRVQPGPCRSPPRHLPARSRARTSYQFDQLIERVFPPLLDCFTVSSLFPRILGRLPGLQLFHSPLFAIGVAGSIHSPPALQSSVSG